MVIKQGELFWVDFGEAAGSSPAHFRPCVVIQNNLFNQSKINTVVVCAITSNLERAKSPGNVLLHKHEANIPKKSVINVSQIYTVDKSDLKEPIGSLSSQKFHEVLNGINLLLSPKEVE